MIINQIFKRKYTVMFSLLFVAAALLAISFFAFINIKAKPGKIEQSIEQADWVKYTNQDFNFTISFPKDWKIYEDFSDVDAPKINIYKPVYKNNLPFDNFSAETNVSIFPKGLKTDAIVGRVQNVDFSLSQKTEKSFDYLLINNQAWASLISFSEMPNNWQSSGFIWLNTEIKNLIYKCSSKGLEIPLDSCKTFEGDILERQGSINNEERATQLRILSTFKFID